MTFVVAIGAAKAQSPPLTGTASLAGVVVTDEANSNAVRRATVVLYVPGDTRRSWVTTTDDRGGFLFDRLPAANVTLFAAKPGYVRTYYGAKRPGSTLAVPIAIADGQRAPGITLKMLRGAAITGTVIDPSGKPMASIPVRARLLTVMPSGERTLTTVPVGAVGSAVTDDRGVYRVFGLPPGDYIVSAQPAGRDFFFNATTASTELRQATAAELQWAERAIAGGAGAAPGADVVPPPSGRSVAYASVYYPGTMELAAAAPVTMSAGQERSSIDLAMQFVATARIEGSVVDANGQPAVGVSLTLSPRGSLTDEAQRLAQMEIGLLMPDASQRSGADGSFAIRGVSPGQYTLWGRSGAGPQALWAMADVDVNGRDVQGVALRLTSGMTVAGRVQLESTGGTPPPQRITVRMNALGSGIGTSTFVTPAAAGTDFTIGGLMPGRYRLVVTVPSASAATASPWVVKSAIAGGRDVADAVIEIRAGADLSGIVVTLGDTSAGVSGVVYDTAGRPTSDLSLVLFPVDRTQWFAGSRRLRAPVRAASDGRFAFSGLPAGEYFLAALNDFEPATWSTPEFLEQVAAAAIKITLGEGEKKVQDVRLAR